MISRSIPHRRATAIGALVAAAALLAVGLPAQLATAAPDPQPNLGALPVKLSPTQRVELLHEAEAESAATARALKLGGKEELVVRDVIKNADGTLHTRYERTYDGLPVLGGDMVVEESPDGGIEKVTKATSAQIAVSSTAASAAHQPQTTAKDTRAPRKVIWAATGEPVLAWERVITGTQEDGTPSELHVITDAKTGEKLYEYQAVHTGVGESMYSGRVTLGTTLTSGQYTLRDTARGNHRTYDLAGRTSGTGTLFTDADDVWGNGSPSNRQTAGVDAHYGAALTWDYYRQVHGRNGVRGDGVAPYTRVHYGNNYANAFWQDSCFCMTYGDGAGNSKPLTSIDVAAHEMTHGLTSNTARLIYSGESGGLNEATSDIFAAAVEFRANNSSDPGDYLIGEKIDLRGNGTPLRYMDRPSKDGNSRDYWSSGIGSINVHYSSGVGNHFFYLLSEGSGRKTINGVTYDSPTYDGRAVTGIGIAKAERIWFKALTERMTSTTNYAGARTATLQAAAGLYGQNSAEYNAVAHAWAAVNVGSRPAGG